MGGRAFYAHKLVGDATGALNIIQMALGAGTTPPIDTDTNLQTAMSGTPATAIAPNTVPFGTLTVAFSAPATATFTATFPGSGGGLSGSFSEAVLVIGTTNVAYAVPLVFNANGGIFARSTWAPLTKNATDTLTITWSVLVSGSI